MRILFIVSVFILVGGCTTNNPLPNKVLLYGHGGGGFDNSALFPPNSVPAMKESLEKYRLDGIEVDVQFTQDTGSRRAVFIRFKADLVLVIHNNFSNLMPLRWR
jgi:hypothetical protein